LRRLFAKASPTATPFSPRGRGRKPAQSPAQLMEVCANSSRSVWSARDLSPLFHALSSTHLDRGGLHIAATSRRAHSKRFAPGGGRRFNIQP
jgi:hypothetical protein